jgi:hypothetical protein
MANNQGIEIADGIPSLRTKKTPLTLKDFRGNKELFDLYNFVSTSKVQDKSKEKIISEKTK